MSTIPGVMLNLEAGPAGGLPRELGGYIARLSVNAAMAEVNIESMASRWESPRSAEELYEQDGCEAMFNAFGGFEHPNYAPDGSEQSVLRSSLLRSSLLRSGFTRHRFFCFRCFHADGLFWS